MEALELIKKLIAIPSFDDGRFYESRLGNFIEAFAKKQLPWLTLTRQRVATNRYNLLFKDKDPCRILIVDHLDSVRPSNSWTVPACKAIINEQKISGLGSSDTKGNVAALLTALKDLGPTKGLAVLFYVDEEYNFAGMKKFIASDLAKTIDPELIWSVDGSGLKLGLGCRGVIQFSVKLGGVTGHSADPKGSVNVITRFYPVIEQLQKKLNQYADAFLGEPNLTVSRVNAGNLLSFSRGVAIFNSQGNVIPDYLEALIEVRTTNTQLNYKKVNAELKELCMRNDLSVREIQPDYDLGSFVTKPEAVGQITLALEQAGQAVAYLDAGTFGYLDMQMLQKLYPGTPMFSLGCGTEGQAHKANEYILISDLNQGVAYFYTILSELFKTNRAKIRRF